MKQWLILASIALAAIVWIRTFDQPHDEYARQRELRAYADGTDIKVAAVWPADAPDSILLGMRLAEKEINARGGIPQTRPDGVIYSRKLRLIHLDEVDRPTGLKLARKIGADPDVVAVIGHEESLQCVVPASACYHNSGVMFIAPTSIDPAVTLHNFGRVFRLAPTAGDISRAMVESASQFSNRKVIRVALLYPEDSLQAEDGPAIAEVASLSAESASLVRRLEISAHEVIATRGLNVDFRIVFERTYKRGKDDYADVIEPLLSRSGRSEFDVILILDVLPDSAAIRQSLDRAIVSRGLTELADRMILDLDQLDWARSEELYGRLTWTDELLDQAAGLVLTSVRHNVAVLVQRGDFGNRLGARIMKDLRDMDSGVRQHVKLYRTYKTNGHSGGPEDAAFITDLLNSNVDCIYLVGLGDPAIQLIRAIRKRSSAPPIIVGPHLESQLMGLSADTCREVYVVSAFNQYDNRPETRSFLRSYVQEYGQAADSLAAVGYQSVKLLEHAFRKCGSTSPQQAADVLSNSRLDTGRLLGGERFARNGDLVGFTLVLKHKTAEGFVHVQTLPQTDSFKATRSGH